MHTDRMFGIGAATVLLALVLSDGSAGWAQAWTAEAPTASVLTQEDTTRTVKTSAELNGDTNPGGLVDPTAGFGVPAGAATAEHEFNRTLRIGDVTRTDLDNVPWHAWNPSVGWETVAVGATDGFDYYESELTWSQFLPFTGWSVEFDADLGYSVVRYHLDQRFVQSGSRLIPTERGQQYLPSPDYNMIWGTGRVWSEPDDEIAGEPASRASVPFTLIFAEENCSFNGLLTFLYNDDGISRVHYQVGSETCAYFKGNMWGNLPGVHLHDSVDAALADSVRQQDALEQANRMPTRSIDQLAVDYPHIDPEAFTQGVSRPDTTAYGLVVDGVHYVSDCVTRVSGDPADASGLHPFCEQVHLPSYSTSKSIFMGGALMMLVERYGDGVLDELVSDWVPELAELDGWHDVTFAHIVDMATGHYDDPGNQVDEAGGRMADFFAYANRVREDKIMPAMGFPRAEDPGQRWVYHSSDSFLLADAMNAYFKHHEGAAADIYEMLFDDLLAPIGVDRDSHVSSRTPDAAAPNLYNPAGTPWGGYGLWWNSDSMARIGDYFTRGDGSVGGVQVLDADMLAASMQRDSSDRGLPTADDPFMYNNGFWARQYTNADDVAFVDDFWVPFMSGFGGITVAMMPNCTTYWRVGDDHRHSWASAVSESHRIAPMHEGACGAEMPEPPEPGPSWPDEPSVSPSATDSMTPTDAQEPTGAPSPAAARPSGADSAAAPEPGALPSTGSNGWSVAAAFAFLLLAVGAGLAVRRRSLRR